MGSLVLPNNGDVYVDANTIIYRVEAVQPYLDISMPLWDALRIGTRTVVTSELSFLEVLVKPIELGNQRLQQLFRVVMYNTRGFSSVSIDRQVLEKAAQLRASTRLKTPDAIHAATALIEGCTLFVTNDPAFRRVPGLNVVVLSDIAAIP